MTNESRKFLLDTNVLITAHRSYYAFDLCPGFWQSISDGHAAGRLCSTVRVRDELLKGKDLLADWLKITLPDGFFLDDSSAEIATEYGPLMSWVVARGFTSGAQAKFASDADGWLIATAKKEGFCLVTHEVSRPEARAKVQMPDVCKEFGVAYCNTFDMLRELGCKFQ
ncbi:DUF4411 family protein [Prosthecobacter sp. SYSU 5D2]|uniref:DUF4411 family protein n=1 Tax=Prosthecobacter sp. SYSU 5D2 TaxID=3134134 RepID=UPI0031FEAC8B